MAGPFPRPGGVERPETIARMIEGSRVPGTSIDYLMWAAERIKQLGSDPTPLLKNAQFAHPGDFWANYVLAEALSRARKNDEAIRFFQAAIGIRPEIALAHNNLANCLRRQNRLDEAVEELQLAVRLDPATTTVRGNLGLTLATLGRHTEALEHFEFGARARPDSVRFRVDLGSVLSALGRDDEAIERLKEAAVLGGGAAMAREALVTGFIRAGRGPEAVAWLRSSIERGGKAYDQWDGFAELCLFVGARDEYEETRKKLLETFGNSTDPVVCERLCFACMLAPIQESQRDVANAAIERAVAAAESRPTARSLHLRLALALSKYRSRHEDAALSIVEEDEVSNTLQPIPQLIAALALADLDRGPEALVALGHAAMFGDNRLVGASRREAWISHVLRREAESKLLPNLDAFTRGTYWPTTDEERFALIGTSEAQGRSHAAARLFVEAFAKDPALAQDLSIQFRYRAACAAALCGGGYASDGRSISPEERSAWRARSLKWLREELAALRVGATPSFRASLLSLWLNDRELLGVRDPAFLAKLPESERAAFTALWAEVNAALASRDSN